MSEIVAGDIVKCVEPTMSLIKDKLYKVTRVCDEYYLYVEGLASSYYVSRFEKVVGKKTRSKWVSEFRVMTSEEIVDTLINNGLLEVAPETPEEVFTQNAVVKYGYAARGTGGYLDELFDMMEEFNMELKFKDQK